VIQPYPLAPRKVPLVETEYRSIRTPIPVPESLPILERLRAVEPVSMSGQPLVVWERAEGVNVYDRWGNRWLDFSSGVLVTNAGHGRREIIQAIVSQAQHGLLHNYCFPSAIRARLASRLAALAPEKLEKVFLLTTGSEAVECTLKLARTAGRRMNPDKVIIVSFEGAFHGRTLGAQLAGGIPSLKQWIGRLDPTFVQVPFPDGFRSRRSDFGFFPNCLEKANVKPQNIAAVLTETYQGAGASFAPAEYMQALRQFCDQYRIALICDEVQAGFGRTGRWFAFEHYDIIPDLVALGKGITSSLPLSAVLGRADLMDLYPSGAMTSTHTGNPVCCAAALANLDIMEQENLPERAARLGEVLHRRLAGLKEKFSPSLAAVHGKGLVAGLHICRPDGETPASALALDIVRRGVEKGLLFFSPVGPGPATIKVAPPLIIPQEALEEGIAVLEEAMNEALSGER